MTPRLLVGSSIDSLVALETTTSTPAMERTESVRAREKKKKNTTSPDQSSHTVLLLLIYQYFLIFSRSLSLGAGSGNDTIHAHFGRGSINCGPGHDTVYMSHKGRAGYKLIGCEKIDYRPEAKRISKPRPTPTAAAASLRSPTRTSPRTSRTRKSKHSAKKYH